MAVATLALLGCGCGGSPVTRVPRNSLDPWVLRSDRPSDTSPALLWNGLLGVRIGGLGSGLDDQGRPQSTFSIKGYDRNETIVAMPNPLAVSWSVDGQTLDASEVSNYAQSLDMRTGVLSTSYQTEDAEWQTESVIDPGSPVVAQRWELTAKRPVKLDVSSTAAYGQTSPSSVTGSAGFADIVFSGKRCRVRVVHQSSRPLKWTIDRWGPRTSFTLDRGERLALDRVAEFRASLTRDSSRMAPESMPIPSFDAVVKTSQDTWRERWETDIEIEGPADDQQAVRSMLFYLRSSINEDADMSVSPFGLSNKKYGGHVFWDADTWVFPALAFIEPHMASAIISYRFKRQEAARKIYERSYGEGGGLKFPWESAVTGEETARAEMRKHLHVTGDVVRAMMIAGELGLTDRYTLQDATAAINDANSLWHRVSVDEGGGFRSIKGVLGPDEYQVVDNDLYTNLLAQWCALKGKWSRSGGDRFVLPSDATSLLAYDGDKVKGYQQASAVLSIYPLQFPLAERQSVEMMQRFPPKTSPYGPSMTESVQAIIWARAGNAERAYSQWRDSWKPFSGNPFRLFAETRTGNDTYFTTGSAGSLQSLVYGFLGFRIDSEVDQGAIWSQKLRGESWLSIKPRLPKAWTKIRFRNFVLFGKRYTLTVTSDGANITPGDT